MNPSLLFCAFLIAKIGTFLTYLVPRVIPIPNLLHTDMMVMKKPTKANRNLSIPEDDNNTHNNDNDNNIAHRLEIHPHMHVRYEIESFTTSIHNDDTAFAVRRNGKVFYLEISPVYFKNSPGATRTYRRYLAILRGDIIVPSYGKDMDMDVEDNDNMSISEQGAHEWMLRPFERLFLQLAPDLDLDHLPGKPVTLADYLFAECFVLRLYMNREKFRPRAVSANLPSGYSRLGTRAMGGGRARAGRGGVYLPTHLLEQTKSWTRLYNPSEVTLSFDNPDDALFRVSKRVTILVNNNDESERKTVCFFKDMESSYSTERLVSELEAYKRVHAARLDPRLKVCRLYGIIVADVIANDDNDGGSVLGLLLTYIDRACPLSCFSGIYTGAGGPSMLARRMWVSQLELALSELHRAGVIWGNVHTENVLIDGDENAWITELGSLEMSGLMEEGAGTVKGDIKGMERLRDFIQRGELRWDR